MRVNDLELHVLDEGSGPAVVLLHGFPDSSALWRAQVPALTGAGFRVIAPDLRGFGASDKPEGVEAYGLMESGRDVIGIMDALGIERAHVVGHDWGAALGWGLAMFAADRVDRFAALSVGHPACFSPPSYEQRRLSWYMLFFQFEDIAEEWLMLDDWKLMREWANGNGDLGRYLEELARPGALTAALSWYRANVRPRPPGDVLPWPRVQMPVLGAWSDGDDYLTEEQMTRSAEHVAGPWRYERIEGASHWIPLDAPERLNELLLSFLA